MENLTIFSRWLVIAPFALPRCSLDKFFARYMWKEAFSSSLSKLDLDCKMTLKFKINEKLHFAFEIARRRARGGKNLCIDENLIKVKNTASSAGAVIGNLLFFGIVVRKSRLKALCLVHIMQFQLFPIRLPFFLLALHHVAPNFRRLPSQMATSSSCASIIDVFSILSRVY